MHQRHDCANINNDLGDYLRLSGNPSMNNG